MTGEKTNFSEPVSMEVLKYLFSGSDESKVTDNVPLTEGLEQLLAQSPVVENKNATVNKAAVKEDSTETVGKTENKSGAPTEASDENDEITLAEAKEISSESTTGNVKIDHIITQSDTETGSVSQSELVKILEAAVSMIRDGKETHANLPQVIQPEPSLAVAAQTAALLEERETEIDELKTLLVEAQSTIIKLLTDRVEDRSKLATLESQVKFLPDFQKANTQAMTAAAASANTDMLLRDLGKVKADLERMKGSRGQAFDPNGANSSGFWARIKRWLTH